MAEKTAKEPVVITAECNGTVHDFLLLRNIMELNKCLQKHGFRTIAETENNWRFDTSLPQSVRDKMHSTNMSYAITPNTPEGMIYFYQSGKTTLSRKLKYLRLFSKENIDIEIGGKTYSYFMTNDEKALNEKLQEYGCPPPTKKDWKTNYALHKNVTDKMSELGAKYSITTSHGAAVLNHYEESIPHIILLDILAAKKSFRETAEHINTMIKHDDVESLEKLSKIKELTSHATLFSGILLELCVINNSKKSAEFLIKSGLDVNVQNNYGITPLMTAAGRGAKELVQLLLDNGADKNIKAKNGWTAIVYALANNKDDIAELLSENSSYLEFHADIEKLQFHEKLGFFIARFISFGKHKTCDIYKNLGGYMTRKTFSKLQSTTAHPRKNSVILLALGMHLSLEDTENLLMSAGHVLSPTDESDQIIKKHIQNRNYNIFEIDHELWNKTQTSLMRKTSKRI